MDNSILNSIKKLLGIGADDSSFDVDIIMHINTYLMVLRQIGIGPSDGYSITDSTAKWSDFLSNSNKLESVVTYIYLRTRLVFDPPTSSTVIESMNANIKELEWRLYTETDTNMEDNDVS